MAKNDDPLLMQQYLSIVTGESLGAIENPHGAPLNGDHAVVSWVYSILNNLLMNSLIESSRVKDIEQDCSPCITAMIHDFGITNAPATFSIKEDSPFSTAALYNVLGDEWDKVANGTAVVTSLKFKVKSLWRKNINSEFQQKHLRSRDTCIQCDFQNNGEHVEEHCS